MLSAEKGGQPEKHWGWGCFSSVVLVEHEKKAEISHFCEQERDEEQTIEEGN